MRKHYSCTIFLLLVLLQIAATVCPAETIVFFEKGFPAHENGSISRTALENCLSPLHPRFLDLAGLKKWNASTNDLLILPYGSAFPADAWETIQNHLEKGNLLVLGGRPLFVPVYRTGSGWRSGNPQNTYARHLGIEHSYAVSQKKPLQLRWDGDVPFFHVDALDPVRVFAHDGRGGRYRGLAFLIDVDGNRISSPVVAEDFVGYAQPPRRRVYLSFDSPPEFWNSSSALDLIRQSAVYASYGGLRLWLDLQQLTLDPGDHISGTIDVVRTGEPAELTLELLNGNQVLASRTTTCGNILHEEIRLKQPLNDPGLYKVRAVLSINGKKVEQYTSGVCVRDSVLLYSGMQLAAGRDYFTLGGKPYLMTGTNYFCTDPYTSAFFVSGSLGGNPWNWETDFAEMEQQGLTAVRTGIWLNRVRYLDDVSKAADERLLWAIEAFLQTAAKHHLQVIFTFFAFDPQTELEPGPGQSGDRLGPGSHPYLDPAAIEAQLAYLRTIVTRFKDVPFLSFDLINEPSFGNPKRHWRGNSPNGDPVELAAWQTWLAKRYRTIDSLSYAWRVPPEELGNFNRVPLPDYSDLELARSGNPRTMRAVDYNLFAQYAFRSWVDTMVHAIRATGARQAITVGQDEGGVADRVLNQFWGESPVDYTVNHSWWRDDALLWSSVAAKTVNKPNLIGETGPQPVSSMDGSSRWDDIGGTPLLERKFVLAFANGGAGILHWDWTRSESFGILKRDGSHKLWMDVLRGVSTFARNTQAYALNAKLPEVALVLPQSLQLSTFGNWGVTVQQNAVRALYHHARATAFAIGEYQISKMSDVKLIIVPAPWMLHQNAWEQLMAKVRAGATLLISGRIDADEHGHPVPERTRGWSDPYSSAALTTREVTVTWPDNSAVLSYSDNRTTYAERGILQSGSTFIDVQVGAGHILYFAAPLELADQLNVMGRIYKFAMNRAGVNVAYETSCQDPGILICPTSLPDATLYVLTSESAGSDPVVFKDKFSGKEIRTDLAPGRGALLLIGKDGRVLASYNAQ